MKKYGVRSPEYRGNASQRSRRPAARSLRTRDSLLRTRHGFTLIELIIVIGIIALVVALGVPMFGVLTGSRSQEAGQNVVAAAIGQARTVALNEGKYAGLLFYVDPATERTAMTLVTFDPDGVSGPGLEDPDPFNKYKSFVAAGINAQAGNPPNSDQVYRAPYTATDGTVVAGDRVIGLSSDVNATFRVGKPAANNVYNSTNLVYSRMSEYFGNMRPTVRIFRGQMAPQDPATGTFAPVPNNATGTLRRPPHNGPFDTSAAAITPNRYIRIGENSSNSVTNIESTNGNFSNDSWGQGKSAASVTSYGIGGTSGERQLLPLNVGVQLIVQPTSRTDVPAFTERYVRTGVIMFDPQGRLTFEPRLLAKADTLGKALGLTADAQGLLAGVGVTFYDQVAFKNDTTRTEADFYYQNVAANLDARINSGYPAFADNAAQTAATVVATEGAEETWLAENGQPLLVNRFSGALSSTER